MDQTNTAETKPEEALEKRIDTSRKKPRETSLDEARGHKPQPYRMSHSGHPRHTIRYGIDRLGIKAGGLAESLDCRRDQTRRVVR